MVISLRRLRRAWWLVRIVLALLILALILPPAIAWVRRLMYSAATRPPVDEDVLTPAGGRYGQPAGGVLERFIEVLRAYYRGPAGG